jgi:hypothetical protein
MPSVKVPLPAIPGMPALPTLPDLPKPPKLELPGLPKLPDIKVPLPAIPGMPALPTLPDLPKPPKLELPGLPKLPDITMALDKNTLKTKIEAAFKKAKETPPPSDPSESGKVQDQILAQLAVDLSDAIDAFVKSGDIAGITVQVRDLANNIIGNGTQTGTVKVQ